MEIIIQIIVGVAVAVCTALFGVYTHRLTARMDQREAEAKLREKRREDVAILTIEGVQSAIALGEANTIALKRGSSNGESERAMEYARSVKHKIKDFLFEQGVRSTVE